jgi:putative ubiquitin-RnfH superfamily antitoxin RatB of RatAB toxin-antitoxin module
MVENNLIHVEVAHALEGRQLILPVEAPQGITAAEAIERSGILQEFTDIDLGKNRLGIFGKASKADTVLQKGDRVEIYRPLTADPKVVRRELAAMGKTMGKDRVRDGG